MSEQSNKMPPVPQESDVLDSGKRKMSHNWTRWLLQVKYKLDVITASIVNLASVSGSGIVSKSGDAWNARTITGSSGDITVTNGDGVSGDPTISSANTGVTAGAYGDATHVARVTVTDKGKITDVTQVEISGGGGGSAFDPVSLFTGVTTGAWFDFTDISQMFQDTAGTVPVTTTGQTVALVKDKSGLGFDASQATSGNRPTLQQDSNGVYYLSFASGNYLTCGQGFNSNSICCVIAYRPTANNGRIIDTRGTGTSGAVKGWQAKGSNPASDLIVLDDGAGSYISITDSYVTNNILTLSGFRYNGSSLYLDYYGDRVNATNSAISDFTNTNTNYIGIAIDGSSQPFVGRLYNIFFVGSKIPFGKYNQLVDYISDLVDF